MITVPPAVSMEIARKRDEETGEPPDKVLTTGNTTEDEPEVCGAELTQGGTCERPAEGCPYHEQ